MHVGGLHTPSNEHRTWDTPEIEIGDTLTVEIVETEDITPHSDARTFDPLKNAQKERDYVRKKACEYGWTIVEQPSSAR